MGTCRSRVLLCTGAFLMLAISSSANISPQAPEPQTTPVTELHPGGEAVALDLAPNTTALCSIDVPAGMTVAVTLREEQIGRAHV